jgi:hypothetical protein
MMLRILAAPRVLAGVRLAAICAAFAFVSLLAATDAARAQTGALPPAPGAHDKAAAGGYTGARASLAGDHGSALEPYLFLAILAGGGLVAIILAFVADGAVRSTRPARPTHR